jgi:hypothetical protein
MSDLAIRGALWFAGSFLLVLAICRAAWPFIFKNR